MPNVSLDRSQTSTLYAQARMWARSQWPGNPGTPSYAHAPCVHAAALYMENAVQSPCRVCCLSLVTRLGVHLCAELVWSYLENVDKAVDMATFCALCFVIGNMHP